MQDLPTQSRNESGFASRITFVFLGVLTLGVAAVVSLISLGAFTKPAPKAVVEAPAPPPAPAEAAPASTGPNARPFAGRGFDPRLMRSPAPVLPVAISEEAQRMVTDMLNVYRCQHSTSQRAISVSLPANGDGGAELKQSLGTLPDPCYVNAVLPKLANPETPGAEMDMLYEDLLRRPNALRLRMMFIIASIESHPKSADALQQLRDLVRTDWQQDWGRWEQAVNQLAAHEDRGVRIASCRAR